MMQIKVDFFAFTLKREVFNDDNEKSVLSQVMDELHARYPQFLIAVGGMDTWTWQAGRKPYRASFRSPDSGMAIWVHPALNHSMIEFTGRGCDVLGEWRDASGFLAAFQDRAVRIDLACDMLTDVSPVGFAYDRNAGRFKSDGHINEESGETVYIGSKKSDRYACVYRYNEPHDRAHLLRCEFRMKSENAKLTTAAILEHGKESVAKALGETFGWKHKAWRVEAPSEIELRAYRPDRKQGATIFWLNDTIAPLLRRLHEAGDLDATEWLRTYVLRDTMSDDTQ